LTNKFLRKNSESFLGSPNVNRDKRHWKAVEREQYKISAMLDDMHRHLHSPIDERKKTKEEEQL